MEQPVEFDFSDEEEEKYTTCPICKFEKAIITKMVLSTDFFCRKCGYFLSDFSGEV